MANLTFKDLKKMAEQEPEEIHPEEAMRRLGPAFVELRECKDGKDFIWKIEQIFWKMKEGRTDRKNVNIHTVIGICQLAHHIRDGVSPSRKKSFKKIIPWLIQLRDKIKKKSPEDVVEFVLQKFEERNRPTPSNIRPESIVRGRSIFDY